MPVYDFRCKDCGKEFTVVLHVEEWERHDVTCPHCHSKEVEQAVTAFQVITPKKS